MSEYLHAKTTLAAGGYWATAKGLEAMQTDQAQAACRAAILEALDRLEPAALLAVMTLATSLADKTPSPEARRGP